jgi:type VI secretion system protein ImpH
MTVTFMGLYGPSGVLPAHYTELLLRLEQDQRGPERHALRAWLDLFNHRLLSLFSRAWEKYRFPILYERSFHEKAQDDPFTRVLFSLIGLGTNGLRQRLQVKLAVPAEPPAAGVPSVPGVLARIDDLALLHYAGLLSRQGRSALGLQALLEDYFGLPVKVVQFQGQWLLLDSASQSRMTEGGACLLGINTVAGGRVWDVQSKVRVRLGPLSYEQFTSFLPDLSPDLSKKNLFLLSHLTRLYLGMELDFEIQLVLRAAEVPPAQLTGGRGRGRQLGWNSWVLSRPAVADADQAVFEGQELTVVGGV